MDVNDCARLHVAALVDQSVENERVFAFAATFNWTDINTILHKSQPRNALLPDVPKDEGRDLAVIEPRTRAEAILRNFWGAKGWKSLQESVTEGIKDLL